MVPSNFSKYMFRFISYNNKCLFKRNYHIIHCSSRVIQNYDIYFTNYRKLQLRSSIPYYSYKKKYFATMEDDVKLIKSDYLKQVDYLTGQINSDMIINLQTIEEIKSNVISLGNQITLTNFDAIFLALIVTQKAFSKGKDFFNCVYSSGTYNLGTIGQYFKLCYICSTECTDNDKAFLLKLYKDLLLKYGNLDFITCENVALGLSITEHWREGFKLIDMSRITATPSSKMYSVLVQAAFRNVQFTEGWNLMHDMIKLNRKPILEAYSSWMQAMEYRKEAFFEILRFLEKYNLEPTEELASFLITSFKTANKSVTHAVITSVHSKGKCRTCFKHLHPVNISDEEFKKLRDIFLDPVLIGRDLFLKTKPEEIKFYFDFLKQIGKVNIVLDGLNIAYAVTHKTVSSTISANMLSSVVKHFVDKSQKVLVIGRKHMQSWPTSQMNYIRRNSFLFLAENISADDPFILYAAMYSGLGTCFVSRDQMRGHKFLLQDTELTSIFSRWQQKHQYYFLHVADNGNVVLKEPLPYLQNVQETGRGSWHIPISVNMPGVPAHLIPNKRNWLCLS